MDTSTLIESFADFAKQKNIDRPTMIRISGRRVPEYDPQKVRGQTTTSTSLLTPTRVTLKSGVSARLWTTTQKTSGIMIKSALTEARKDRA
jgi:hypothetical protein